MKGQADMAELADAPDLGSGGQPRAGSSPVIRIRRALIIGVLFLGVVVLGQGGREIC